MPKRPSTKWASGYGGRLLVDEAVGRLWRALFLNAPAFVCEAVWRPRRAASCVNAQSSVRRRSGREAAPGGVRRPRRTNIATAAKDIGANKSGGNKRQDSERCRTGSQCSCVTALAAENACACSLQFSN